MLKMIGLDMVIVHIFFIIEFVILAISIADEIEKIARKEEK